MNINNLILDGTCISYRFYYNTRHKTETNNKGKNIEIISEYLKQLNSMIKEYNPVEIHAAWDFKIEPKQLSYRQDLLKGLYKADRKKPKDVLDLYDQERRIIDIIKTLNVKCYNPNSLEADDVVAFLAKNLEGPNIIVSLDGDLLQLINEKNSVWNFKRLITKSTFENDVGVESDKYKLYKAIKGDSSDNIPGLPGYGKIRAARLAKIWHTSTISEEYKTIVERNLKLIDLDYGVNIQPNELKSYSKQFEDNKLNTLNKLKFLELCFEEGVKINPNDWNNIFNKNCLCDMINSISDKYLKGD